MTPGRVNYDAYKDYLTHSLYGGALLPPWPMLDRAMQDAWEMAAQAVESNYIELTTVEEENNLTHVKKSDG